MKSVILGSFLLMTGCGENTPTHNSPKQSSENNQVTSDILSSEATAIAIDKDGKLIDFVRVKENSELEKIIFSIPTTTNEIFVVCVGNNINKLFPKNMVISTSNDEYALGKVEVDVEDGIIMGANGNGMSYKNILTNDLINEIEARVNKSDYKKTTDLVYKDRFRSKCYEDENGNLVQKDLGPREQEFIKLIQDSFSKKSTEKIEPIIHQKEKNESFNTVKMFLEQLMKDDLKRYEFYQYDPTYKGHQSNEDSHHSLEAKWIMTLHFSEKGDMMMKSADLIIGEHDSKLMIPTEYGN